MVLKEKIANAIQSLSADEIDQINREDLAYLGKEQIVTYIARAKALGREYYVEMGYRADESEPFLLRYGTFSTWVESELVKDKNWTLMHGAGLVPITLIENPPLMVTKETFINKAKQQHIPQEYIGKITSGGPKSMDNF